MKKYLFLAILLRSLSTFSQGLPIVSCAESSTSNPNFSKAKQLQQALDEITRLSVPGISMAIYSPEGWWLGSSGFAKIEDQTPMQNCHLLYSQSVAKLYLAVGILKLVEEGKIELDASMTKYLPQKYRRYIADSTKITVRMLMNHTSGIPEYNFAPAYVSKLLQHPEYDFTQEEYLAYIKGKPLDFPPGSKYAYRNTNYVILSLIADSITGDHAKWITEKIFKPLDLTNTFYRYEPGYLTYTNLVNSYWDRHGDGAIENISALQRNNVACLYGDDGIVATPEDYVKFLKGLMEGKLLAASSMEQMKTFVKDKKGNPTYGLGLDYNITSGQISYGHSGGGIAAGCQLYYFPEKNVYYFIGINLGTITDSPLHVAVEKTLNEIYGILLR